MPQRVTEKRKREFIASLKGLGGSCINSRLIRALDWEEDFYWKVQEALIEQSAIVPGRGQGGSVRLTSAEAGTNIDGSVVLEVVPSEDYGTSIEDASVPLPDPTRRRRATERPLYGPIKEAMEAKWIGRFGFENVIVEETHSRGSRATGGTFTRPDITVAGMRSYVFLPKRLEIITFEIKPAESVDIMGVLEAVAHREAAHRAYVVYAIGRSAFDSAAEVERISELAQKFGIGVVLTEEPGDASTWEIALEAVRHEPDPARLDRFLGDLPSETMKNQIHRWRG